MAALMWLLEGVKLLGPLAKFLLYLSLILYWYVTLHKLPGSTFNWAVLDLAVHLREMSSLCSLKPVRSVDGFIISSLDNLLNINAESDMLNYEIFFLTITFSLV